MTENAPAHAPVKTYLLVFAGLAALTALTVFLSYAHLPHGKAVLAAALIALTKCSLIAAFFMHLKSERRGIAALIFVALFFITVLVASLIGDLGILR